MNGGEFDWIAELASRFGSGVHPDGSYGIGDDAAVLPGGGAGWVVSVDAQVSGVHFRPEWVSWSELGRRVLHVGFSDIAAMGARPYAALVSVEVGPEVTAADRALFTEGIAAATDELHARLIGGNVSGRASGFSAHVTALGRPDQNRVLTRAGARPGDAVCLTGFVGGAAAGRAVLERYGGKGLTAAQSEIVAFYRRPRAHWREGMILAAADPVSAAIDVSDGLAADLGHICRAGGVGARIDAGALPIEPCVREWCGREGLDPIDLALNGGEDYVLLFTARPRGEALRAIEEAVSAVGGRVWQVGEITEGTSLEVKRGGQWQALAGRGFDHLARS